MIHTCEKCGVSRSLNTLSSRIVCGCGFVTQHTGGICKHRGEIIAKADGSCSGKRDVFECQLFDKPCWSVGCSKPWPSIKCDPPLEKQPRACAGCECNTSELARWRDVSEPEFHQSNDRLVITVAVGREAKELLHYTGPRMSDYASRCDADFVSITNPTQNWWGLEKFRIRHWARHYKQVLFLDCDVWICDGAPSIFDFGCLGILGMHADFEHQQSTDWVMPEYTELCDSQEILCPESSQLLNTGVVLFPGAASDIWNPPRKPFKPTHCSEQFWVERNICERGYKVLELDRRWNMQWWMPDFEDRKTSANFLHMANAPHKTRLVEFEMMGLVHAH